MNSGNEYIFLHLLLDSIYYNEETKKKTSLLKKQPEKRIKRSNNKHYITKRFYLNKQSFYLSI